MANTVYIGKDQSAPDFSFDDDSITELSVNTEVNFVMDEITADTVEFTVIYEDTDKTLIQLDWATPVHVYSNNVLVGKFYSKNVTRVGADRYKIDCTSLIGLLDYETYYGKVYTGETFKQAVEDVISTNGLTTYRGAAKSLRVYDKDEGETFFGPWYATEDVAMPFHAALMEATVTINRSLLNEIHVESLATATKARDVICGSMPNQSYIDAPGQTGQASWQFAYGLYIEFERASTSDPWPSGEVYFSYYTLRVPLGTLIAPMTYEIYCDPKNKRLTINGAEYTLPDEIPYYSSQYPQFYRAAYGGKDISPGLSNVVADASLPHDVTYCKYKLSKISEYTLNPSSGTFANIRVIIPSNAYYIPYLDAYAVMDAEGELHVSNSATGYHMDDQMVNTEMLAESFVPFISESSYQKEILDTIQYSPGIDTLEIHGWMPVLSKREAIHQLMFSQGIVLRKDANGSLLFSAPTTDYYEEISPDEIYDKGTKEYLEHTNFIRVTEHSYQSIAGKAAETIYSTNIPSTSDFAYVEFTNAPIIGDPTANGLYLYAWNCNAAIVGGVGDLSGVTYEHTKSILTRKVGNYVDGRELSVKDATLITYLNSGNVMDRLASYYADSYLVKNSIILSNHRTGNYYKFTDPFGKTSYGFLKKIDRVFSSIIKGNCEFLCNYNPPDIGMRYQNFVILTGSGTWNVPESVFTKLTPQIRVVVIAAGDGGESGTAGERGQVTPAGWSDTPSGSKGGDQGATGAQGRFFEITIENPASSYTYMAGLGGAGGEISTSTTVHNGGGLGGDSVLSDGENTYASYYGERSEYGIVNFFTGDVYAKVSTDGPIVSGQYYKSPQSIWPSSGGGGGIFSRTNNYYVFMGGGVGVRVEIGSQILGYPGGARGQDSISGNTLYASGGCGGGGAAGQNGSPGSNASGSRAGNGGKGADATWIPPTPLEYNPTYYGYGGYGGAGGGGGGSTGGTSPGGTTGTPGNGGYGGKGGAGGNGCILIYY